MLAAVYVTYQPFKHVATYSVQQKPADAPGCTPMHLDARQMYAASDSADAVAAEWLAHSSRTCQAERLSAADCTAVLILV